MKQSYDYVPIGPNNQKKSVFGRIMLALVVVVGIVLVSKYTYYGENQSDLIETRNEIKLKRCKIVYDDNTKCDQKPKQEQLTCLGDVIAALTKQLKKRQNELFELLELDKPEEQEVTFDVILVSAGSSKLNVVKVVKSLTGLGLKEAKDLVDNAPSTIAKDKTKDEAEDLKKSLEGAGAEVELKRTSAPVVTTKPPVQTQPPVQTEFNVVLVSAGPSKLAVVKAVKELTGLGLKEAKELVDSAPVTIAENKTKDEAASLKKSLEEAGAEVEIK